MYRIIDGRGTGKTGRLMLLAKENHSTIVCRNVPAMKAKAFAYGITGINFMSYYDFTSNEKSRPEGNYMIDELESFLKFVYGNNIIGYTISNED